MTTAALAPDVAGRTASWEQRAMARMCAGDESALGQIYDQYSAFVYGLARRVTNDADAARDIAQEVFVSLWQRPEAFDGGRGSLRSWLGVLTHRRAVDRVRRESAAHRRDAADAAKSVQPPPDIAEAATSVVVSERIREAVANLPDDQRVCIQLAYFAGHTFREVASLLGIPEGTAKSRLRIALQKLAGTLQAEGITQWT